MPGSASKNFWTDKNILVTGGSGSFGTKFTELLLKEYNPHSVRIYSRGEHRQLEMQRKFAGDHRLRFFVGDVREIERLSRAMNGADVVVHAAALKQVPLIEYNPIEAVKTNINGTANVIDAALDNGVERAMLISSDKAVQPVNLYGATKLVAEKLFVEGNAYSGGRGSRFSCVRYGNVFGSQGSAVPLFLEQRSTGTITVTDRRMTRFWITIEEGVRFVMSCIEKMRGGEIFVPKLPSMKIIDMVKALAPDCKIKYIGIRPGEKLHEVLISEEEARRTRDLGRMYVIEPSHPWWSGGHLRSSKPFPEGFQYTSNGNNHWLSVEQIKKMIQSR